ncbi:MAG: hypothetical protein ACRDRT_01950 [Pseudonocardiaceae bacterium]
MRRATMIGGILMAVAAMIAGGIFIASVLRPGEASCGSMASRAARAALNVRRIDLIISLSGNNASVASEASAFVGQALASTVPGDQAVATIRLLVGDRIWKPSGATCVGPSLLVSASEADLRNYKSSTSAARKALETQVVEQYSSQVAELADQVAAAVRSAPPPGANTGAFFIWPFVAEAPPDRDVYVLGSFTTAGDNCLTFDDPTATRADGRKAFLVRVQECVKAHELDIAGAGTVRLASSQALDLSGGQKQAQRSVMESLCAAAASGRCLVDGADQPAR